MGSGHRPPASPAGSPWCAAVRRALAVALAVLAWGLTPVAAEQSGRTLFSVRAMPPAGMPADTSREWLQFLGPGLASGALGLAAPPMYASALVVGGLLLAPTALLMSGRERLIWQSVTTALGSIAFEQALLRALTERAQGRLPERAGGDVRVELIVQAYGLVGARPERVCFIASVDLVVRGEEGERRRATLRIAQTDASADAPPPQCASLERFAARDGQLVRDTANEYAQVLAVMAIDRLEAGGP